MKYLKYNEQDKKTLEKIMFLKNKKKLASLIEQAGITVIFLGGWSHGIIFLRWSLGMVFILEMVLLVHKK